MAKYIVTIKGEIEVDGASSEQSAIKDVQFYLQEWGNRIKYKAKKIKEQNGNIHSNIQR